MKAEMIMEPIGMRNGINAIRNACNRSNCCNHTRRPPTYLITLNEGDGRTTFTKYTAEMFRHNNVIDFHGLDLYLETAVSENLDELRLVFADIENNAVYTNHYEGIVAMDLARLADAENDVLAYLVSKINQLHHYCEFLFFVPRKMSRNMEAMVRKFIQEIRKAGIEMEQIEISPYSSEEVLSIVKRMLDEDNISLEEGTRTDSLLSDYIEEKQLHKISEARNLSQELIAFADFHPTLSTLTTTQLKDAILSFARKENA